MADSIRQQIIDKIDERFKTILTTNGYKSNAGGHVFHWLDRDLSISELPAINYKDPTNEIDGNTILDYSNRLTLEIEIKVENASTTPESLRDIIDDVYKAIGTDDRWSGLALDSQPKSEAIDIQQGDRIVGSATLTIEIEYETAKWGY